MKRTTKRPATTKKLIADPLPFFSIPDDRWRHILDALGAFLSWVCAESKQHGSHPFLDALGRTFRIVLGGFAEYCKEGPPGVDGEPGVERHGDAERGADAFMRHMAQGTAAALEDWPWRSSMPRPDLSKNGHAMRDADTETVYRHLRISAVLKELASAYAAAPTPEGLLALRRAFHLEQFDRFVPGRRVYEAAMIWAPPADCVEAAAMRIGHERREVA